MTTILFETLWHKQADGWSIASRAYARAMHEAGIKVQLHSWIAAVEDVEPEVEDEVRHMLVKDRPRDLYVFSCTLSGEWGTPFTLKPLSLARRPRAFYTMFERQQIDANTIAGLRGLEAVWVPCSFNKRILDAAGLEHVTWHPYPYFDNDPHLQLPPPKREPKTFLWVGRWEPRKAPHNLIVAFMRAFRPGEARLILKVGPVPWTKTPYKSPEECLLELTSSHPRWSLTEAARDIEIIRPLLTPKLMRMLHAQSDIYVSASRGEGLDLPAYVSKLAGRRVVTTDSGGPTDFLDENDIIVPAKGSVPCGKGYRWDDASTFIDYDVDDLVAAMQAARGLRYRRTAMPEKFRAENVGAGIKRWAEEILERCPVEPAAPPSLVDFGQWVLDGQD